LTKALSDAVDDAVIKISEGPTKISISLETQEDIKLFWAYQPKPGVTVPQRYLTKSGMAGEPTTGMIDEDFA
jgi:galactose mutarotase-like enzyme